jgi:ribonuclease HI
MGMKVSASICDMLELSSRDGRVYWEWCKHHGGGTEEERQRKIAAQCDEQTQDTDIQQMQMELQRVKDEC